MRRFRLWIVVLPVLLTIMIVSALRHHRARREARFDPVVQAASKRYGIEAALIKAVVWQESGFDPEARGKAGEIGLMQIRDGAAVEWVAAERLKSFSPAILADPTTNVLVGTWYLGKLLRRYQHTDGPVAYALADYNAGRRHVLRWTEGAAATNAAVFLQQISYPGTRRYIEKVVQRLQFYRRATANSG